MKKRLMIFDKAKFIAKENGYHVDFYNNEICYIRMNEIPWGHFVEVIRENLRDELYVVCYKDLVYNIPICLFEYETQFTTSEEILKYGNIITDDAFGKTVTELGKRDAIRIRLVACGGELYYHKMIDGEVVDFKLVGKVNA